MNVLCNSRLWTRYCSHDECRSTTSLKTMPLNWRYHRARHLSHLFQQRVCMPCSIQGVQISFATSKILYRFWMFAGKPSISSPLVRSSRYPFRQRTSFDRRTSANCNEFFFEVLLKQATSDAAFVVSEPTAQGFSKKSSQLSPT